MDEGIHKIRVRVDTNQDLKIEDLDCELSEKSQNKRIILPSPTKSRKELLTESHATKYHNHMQVISSLLEK